MMDEDFDVDAEIAALVARLPIPDPSSLEGHAAAQNLRARLLDRADLATLPRPCWQIESWIPAGSLVVTYGKPGAGKTLLALDMSCSVATGTRWHGCHVERGPVLYVAAEGAGAFDARISAWEGLNDTKVTGLHVYPDAVNLLSTEWAEGLAKIARELGAVLVTIDTLNRCMSGGDENSARDMGIVVAACDIIRRESGSTVHVIHHVSRAGGNPRGSSALDGAADTMISVSAENGTVTVQHTKQKDGEAAPPRLLKMTPEGISVALADHVETNILDGPRLAMLRTLCDLAGTNGVASGVWENTARMTHSTFNRHRKWLIAHDLCHAMSGTRPARYGPTDEGRAACANHVPPRAMARGHDVPANPHP